MTVNNRDYSGYSKKMLGELRAPLPSPWPATVQAALDAQYLLQCPYCPSRDPKLVASWYEGRLARIKLVESHLPVSAEGGQGDG